MLAFTSSVYFFKCVYFLEKDNTALMCLMCSYSFCKSLTHSMLYIIYIYTYVTHENSSSDHHTTLCVGSISAVRDPNHSY